MSQQKNRKSCIAIKRKNGVDYRNFPDDRLETIEYHINNVTNDYKSNSNTTEEFNVTEVASKLKLLNKGLVNTVPVVYSHDNSGLVIINMTLEKQIVDYMFVIH